MPNEASACENLVLASLDAPDRERLWRQLEPVILLRGQVLCESSRRISHVHFPTSALVSLSCGGAGGDSSDVALIGYDGIVGVTYCTDDEGAPGRAVVQRTGAALRVPAPVLRREFERGGSLHRLTLRYELLLMAQMSQAALCNRHHRVEQQLCRWLLTSMDLCGSTVLYITQQQLAGMLGVRREGVSGAAGKLQAAGILRWSRGRVRIVDRARLEGGACECYEALRAERGRLLPRAEPEVTSHSD
jgi:CRP-like cAMP-binding protein